jgi:hypothetical protein
VANYAAPSLRQVLISLALRSTRTPPASPSALSHLPASSAPLSVSVQAGPVGFIRQAAPEIPPMQRTTLACIVYALGATFLAGCFVFMARRRALYEGLLDKEAAGWRRLGLPGRFVDAANRMEKSKPFATLVGVTALLFFCGALYFGVLSVWPELRPHSRFRRSTLPSSPTGTLREAHGLFLG